MLKKFKSRIVDSKDAGGVSRRFQNGETIDQMKLVMAVIPTEIKFRSIIKGKSIKFPVIF